MIYFYVGLGGAIGSLLRYAVSVFSKQLFVNSFPIGTMFVNLTGAFILGWITRNLMENKKFHPHLITAISTGIIGSYTTFSTFSVDMIHQIEEREYLFALFYMMISFFAGLYLAYKGYTIGKTKEGLHD